MISIKQQSDETVTIEGLTESDLMTLYMITHACHLRIIPKITLANEAFNFGHLIWDFYHKQNG
jgi:hypothetical protein